MGVVRRMRAERRAEGGRAGRKSASGLSACGDLVSRARLGLEGVVCATVCDDEARVGESLATDWRFDCLRGLGLGVASTGTGGSAGGCGALRLRFELLDVSCELGIDLCGVVSVRGDCMLNATHRCPSERESLLWGWADQLCPPCPIVQHGGVVYSVAGHGPGIGLSFLSSKLCEVEFEGRLVRFPVFCHRRQGG
jgi:hypothetical protein